MRMFHFRSLTYYFLYKHSYLKTKLKYAIILNCNQETGIQAPILTDQIDITFFIQLAKQKKKQLKIKKVWFHVSERNMRLFGSWNISMFPPCLSLIKSMPIFDRFSLYIFFNIHASIQIGFSLTSQFRSIMDFKNL